MKYLILLLAYVITWYTGEEDFKYEFGIGGGLGCIFYLLICAVITVIWLVIFFVFDLNLPSITIKL